MKVTTERGSQRKIVRERNGQLRDRQTDRQK